MRRIMDFRVNARSKKPVDYTVYLTDKIEGKEGYLGYTDYNKKIVVIEDSIPAKKMIETASHEFMHVWLEENGYDQNKLFNVEELCDIVAKSTFFVHELTIDFINSY